MITVIQGYAGKRNRAVLAIAEIAGMSAMIRNKKTLVLQLINNDTNCVEQLMLPRESNRIVGGKKQVIPSMGIDALINDVMSRRLMKDDFDKSCTAMMKMENLLDVAIVSKSNKFTSILVERLKGIENILQSAKEVYDNIFILCPTGDPLITEKVNNLADKSIYCLLQGRKFRKDEVYGKNVSYLVMDYESESSQTLNAMKKHFIKEKPRMFKIEHNVKCNDASSVGTLLQFIRDNCKCDSTDRNYDWMMDIKKIIAFLFDDRETQYEEKEDWEDFPVQLLLATEFEHLDILEVPTNETEVKKGLFGRKKYVGLKPITTTQKIPLETKKTEQKEDFYIKDFEDDAPQSTIKENYPYQQETLFDEDEVANPQIIPMLQPIPDVQSVAQTQQITVQQYEREDKVPLTQQYAKVEKPLSQEGKNLVYSKNPIAQESNTQMTYEKVCTEKVENTEEDISVSKAFSKKESQIEEEEVFVKEVPEDTSEPKLNQKSIPLPDGYMTVEKVRAELEMMEKIPEGPEEEMEFIDLSDADEKDDEIEIVADMETETVLYQEPSYEENAEDVKNVIDSCETEDEALKEKINANYSYENSDDVLAVPDNEPVEQNTEDYEMQQDSEKKEEPVEMVNVERKKIIRDDFGKIIKIEVIEEKVPLESLL